MQTISWCQKLEYTLASLRRPDRPSRLAILGVGHELRGDDAVGLTVARSLRMRDIPAGRCLVIDAGPCPENYTGILRRFRPDLVLLIDAAQMSAAPGTMRWLSWRDTVGSSTSTHSLPLRILAQYLVVELGCEVALLGIQPADTSVDTPLSSSAQEAVEAMVQGLLGAFQKYAYAGS